MNDFQNNTIPAADEGEIEEQRSREVNELLEQNGVTREEVATSDPDHVCKNGLCDEFDRIMPIFMINSKNDGKEFCPKCGEQAFPVGSPEAMSSKEKIEQNREAEKAAVNADQTTATNGIGAKIADNLVPAFGETLEKYESGALAFGFPPAVDALITKTGIDNVRAEMVLSNFRKAFEMASVWQQRASAIVVTDASQVELIAEAKAMHKIIRDDRINVEKRRKELKEPSLREGQLIDGVANVYKDLLEPIEKHLHGQAKFVENLEAERKAKLAEERGAKLALFDVDPKTFPTLGDMTDEAFEIVYNGVRQKYQELQAEAETRLKAEREREIENERLRQENARLEADRKAEADRAAEQKRIADEATAKLKQAEEEKARIEAERLAEEERLRLAPDKDKLLDFAAMIERISVPELDLKCMPLMGDVERDLQDIVAKIRKFAETL